MTQNIAGHIVKRKKAIPFPTSSAPAYKTLSNVYEEVYNTPEIRQTILSFLPRTELIKIVTLEKKIVADVAKELYHTVTYRQVKKMRRTTEARAICADAVRCVTFDAPPITADLQKRWPELQEKYGLPKPARRRAALLERYDDSTVNIILLDIRKTCPNIKTLKHNFKKTARDWDRNARASDDWEVTTDRTDRKNVTVDSIVFCFWDDSIDLLGTYVSSPSTRISVNYDLRLCGRRSKPWAHWRPYLEKALEDNKNIRELDLGKAAITLVELATFLEAHHSTDSRSTDKVAVELCLETVVGNHLSVVHVDDLRRLGRAIGEHLTYLNLQNWESSSGHLQLCDLDELEITIQRDLPNLAVLALTFDYGNDMEAECLTKLQPRMSLRTGRLYVLDICFAEDVDVHGLYNLARRLNPFIRQSTSKIYLQADGHQVECATFCDVLSNLEESQVEVAFSMDINELGLNCMGHVSQLRWDGTQPFLSNDPPIEQRHDRYLYMTNWQRLDELKRAEADQKKLNLSPW